MSKALFFLLFLFANTSNADIYKWVDSQGIVHYGDQPHAGSEQIKPAQVQGYSPPNPTIVIPAIKDSTQENVASTEEVHHYDAIAIVEPVDQATIRNNKGYVLVSAQMQPGLIEGDKLQLLLDDNPWGDTQAALIFELRDLDRGTHTIAIQVLSEKGTPLITSNKVTVFMQRPRVGMVKRPA
jgi:hypothetical protein